MAFPATPATSISAATVNSTTPAQGTSSGGSPTGAYSKNNALFAVSSWVQSGSTEGTIILELQGSWDNTVWFQIADTEAYGNGTYFVGPTDAPVLSLYLRAVAYVPTGTVDSGTLSATVTATVLAAP